MDRIAIEELLINLSVKVQPPGLILARCGTIQINHPSFLTPSGASLKPYLFDYFISWIMNVYFTN
jgi:hypothetical protein